MELEYTYWQDAEFFVGFLNDYPEDSTQGLSLAELEEALIEVYEIRQEEKQRLASIRKTGKIRISCMKRERLLQKINESQDPLTKNL